MIKYKNQKDETDLVKLESQKLETYVQNKGYKVLKEFSQDSIFKTNEYVLLENGIYIQIIDYGKGAKPVEGAKIQSRPKGFFINSEALSFNGFEPSNDVLKVNWPLEFTFGDKSFEDSYFLSESYFTLFFESIFFLNFGASFAAFIKAVYIKKRIPEFQ